MIVDDYAVIRAGLRMLIEQDQRMSVVSTIGPRAEALQIAQHLQPDIVVLNLLLCEESGLNFLSDLCKASPASRALVLTGVQTSESHRKALSRGAMGIVQRQHAAELLLKAIHRVHEGEVWVDRTMMSTVLSEVKYHEYRRETDPEQDKIKTLTPREREVIALVAKGLKNKEIAERLFISETTVTHHLSSIYSKLGVSHRLELVVYALANKLVDRSDST
jgi:DNA-binding NarL/FixJ family response regulator